MATINHFNLRSFMIRAARSDREPSVEWLRQQIVATVEQS
jgi:hypothetical protein